MDKKSRALVIIAAYNEEQAIAHKLENSLALDYYGEKIEIIGIIDKRPKANEIINKSTLRNESNGRSGLALW